jgi:hypothetical protein
MLYGSGASPDPDPEPDVWDRIRIRIIVIAHNKWPYINFFVMCKSHKYFRNPFFLTFWVMTILYIIEHVCAKKIFIRI